MMNKRLEEMAEQCRTQYFDEEKFAKLIMQNIVNDLSQAKWLGVDAGWDLAIEAVRKDLIKNISELSEKKSGN